MLSPPVLQVPIPHGVAVSADLQHLGAFPLAVHVYGLGAVNGRVLGGTALSAIRPRSAVVLADAVPR